MKKIKISIALLLTCLVLNADNPRPKPNPSPVIPLVAASAGSQMLSSASQTATTVALLKDIKKIAEESKKVLTVVKGVREIQKAIRLLELVDALVCRSEDYTFYMRLNGNVSFCGMNFNAKLIDTKLSFASKILDLAMSADALMNFEGRVKSLDDAIAALDEVHSEMEETISSIRMRFRKGVVRTYEHQKRTELFNVKFS